MLDFKRIGGEIISSPLNENFRQLRNEISIANTNLIFSETDGVKDTIDDMLAIQSPENAQVCYVISSGELYRYASGDKTWHKIADFGQTFRHGFLSSGAVVLEAPISLKADSKTILTMPSMLVYFKNKPGDNKYLKGMYLIDEAEVDVSEFVTKANSYSIFVDEIGNYTITSGTPTTDNPSLVHIGTFLVDNNKEIISQFIYTIPDMPYTADRNKFLMEGGQVAGLTLTIDDGATTTFGREGGYYYDEGIGYTEGKTAEYPVNTDDSSNYNIKYFEPQATAHFIYMTPKNSLSNILEESDEIINNKYWDGSAVVEVPENYYTIQHHLVTPNGQSIMLFGDKLYNSITDAISHINDNYSLDINFPYVETNRVVVGNVEDFSVNNAGHCSVFLLKQLIQAGTIVPEFADNLFKIYDGDDNDTSPASIRFNLDKLKEDSYNQEYNLIVAPFNTTRYKFSLPTKYLTDDEIPEMEMTISDTRTELGNGYLLADNKDIEYLRSRVNDIEAEIWSELDATNTDMHNQSIRYRLFNAEKRLAGIDSTLKEYGERIDYVEDNKVHKKTTINGYTLGDTDALDEQKSITLYTGDVQEGKGKGSVINQWFTQERVKENEWVIKSNEHYSTVSQSDTVAEHTKTNPHNLSTDDINYLTDTDRLFVSVEEERRIRADRLPDNTIQALADLDAKNIDSVKVDTIDGASWNTTGTITPVGDITGIRFYEHGTNLELSEDGKTLIVECKGQADEDLVMMRHRYATKEMADPTNPELQFTVDKAVTSIAANAIHGIASAGPDKYYGTDKDGLPGIHDIQKFVTTADAESFASIDQVTFVPIDGSVIESHLSSDLANKINHNYHEIYNTGELKSSQINKFNFGDNLTVTINGDTATINATGELSGVGVLNFANLADVDVTYTGNKGRMLVVNEEENGLVVSNALSLDEYMLETVYVDPDDVTKVKKAKLADNATLATTATNALSVNNKSVDDSKTNNTALWTAEKIISNTSSQIQNEGVNTYSGTTVPSDTLGKNGDLYILIES